MLTLEKHHKRSTVVEVEVLSGIIACGSNLNAFLDTITRSNGFAYLLQVSTRASGLHSKTFLCEAVCLALPRTAEAKGHGTGLKDSRA